MGKTRPKSVDMSEYGIAKSTIKTWVERYNDSGAFNIYDNRTEEERELIELRKSETTGNGK